MFTRTGLLPETLSALRAWHCPLYAFTDVPQVFLHMLLLWGVEPFQMDFKTEPEETIMDAMAFLVRRGWVKKGDWMVVITNALAEENVIDAIQMRPVP